MKCWMSATDPSSNWILVLECILYRNVSAGTQKALSTSRGHSFSSQGECRTATTGVTAIPPRSARLDLAVMEGSSPANTVMWCLVIPTSSSTSRRAASTTDSPSSRWPPGRHTSPGDCTTSSVRLVRSTSSVPLSPTSLRSATRKRTAARCSLVTFTEVT